jgi:hypothetical protein
MTSEPSELDAIRADISLTEARISVIQADMKARVESFEQVDGNGNLILLEQTKVLSSLYNVLNSQQMKKNILLEGNFSYFLYLIYFQLIFFLHIIFQAASYRVNIVPPPTPSGLILLFNLIYCSYFYFQLRLGASIAIGMFHLFISLFGSCEFVYLEQRLGFWGSRGGDSDKIIVASSPRVFAAEAAATQLLSSFVIRRIIAPSSRL